MAINGIAPTVAGVFGVKDYTNLLNQSNGMGKLIGTALDMYKFGAQRQDAKDAAQASRDFQAEQGELNRQHQTDMENARWARDEALMQRQEALQQQKELAALTAEASPIIDMNIDERNKGAVMDKANRLQQVIAKAKNIGDDGRKDGVLARATREYNRLMGMYAKDSGGQRTGGVLQDIEEQEAAQAEHAKSDAAIKEQISAGATESAMGLIADAIAAGTITQQDADRYMALIQAKQRDLSNQRRSDISSIQHFQDEQKKRGQKTLD